MNEKISTLIDQQGDPAERHGLLKRVATNTAARDTWQRYHLIGSVLRGEVQHTGADMSTAIRAQLEHEPTVLSPARVARPGNARGWQRVVYMAAAAAVGAMAVLLGPRMMPFTQPDAPQVAIQAPPTEPVILPFDLDQMMVQHEGLISSPGFSDFTIYTKVDDGSSPP